MRFKEKRASSDAVESRFVSLLSWLMKMAELISSKIYGVGEKGWDWE